MIGVSILGSTGSIGLNTLDVIERHAEQFRVVAISAHQNTAKLFEQCLRYQPHYAVTRDEQTADELRAKLASSSVSVCVLSGTDGLAQIAKLKEADCVVAAIVGAAGLLPTLAAVQAGKRVLLANKESLVMMGALFMEAVEQHGATLLPVDSEHSALLQCLAGASDQQSIRRLFITASGGPFRQMSLPELVDVTPEQAAAHPVWSMGRKISIDSATMMNKALEVIEAAYLFQMPPERLHVLLHPQSIVHALVEYQDGSVIAQMANPDMRIPIACALAWPKRIQSGVDYLDLITQTRLDFSEVSGERYPCLALGYQALRQGGTAPAVLNAANEVAVQAFVDGRLKFTAIAEVIHFVLTHTPIEAADTLAAVLAADATARDVAWRYIDQLAQVTLT